MLHRRTFLHLSAFAVAQLAFQRVVRAQSYPAYTTTPGWPSNVVWYVLVLEPWTSTIGCLRAPRGMNHSAKP